MFASQTVLMSSNDFIKSRRMRMLLDMFSEPLLMGILWDRRPLLFFSFCLMVSSPRASGCRRRGLYNNLVAMPNDAASY